MTGPLRKYILGIVKAEMRRVEAANANYLRRAMLSNIDRHTPKPDDGPVVAAVKAALLKGTNDALGAITPPPENWKPAAPDEPAAG